MLIFQPILMDFSWILASEIEPKSMTNRLNRVLEQMLEGIVDGF